VSVSRIGDIAKGVADAINQRSPDQGGSRGASVLRHDAGELSAGADCGRQQVEGATASDDPWLEALVPGGECQN